MPSNRGVVIFRPRALELVRFCHGLLGACPANICDGMSAVDYPLVSYVGFPSPSSTPLVNFVVGTNRSK
jgi:hypothetical protein